MLVRERQVNPEQAWVFEAYLILRGFEDIREEYEEFGDDLMLSTFWWAPNKSWVEVLWNNDYGLLRFGNGAEPLIEDVR